MSSPVPTADSPQPAVHRSPSQSEGVGRSVVQNMFWNVAGSGWNVALTLVTTPFVVYRLGVSTYGVYALLGVFLGYFKFLDLGFSRAIERFSAAARGGGREEEVERIFHTGLTLQYISAVAGACIILGVAEAVLPLLKISPDRLPEALDALRFSAATFALNLANGGAAGLLRAYERFSTLNRISMISSTFTTLLTIGMIAWSPTLAMAVIANLIGAVVGIAWAQWEAARIVGRFPRFRLHRGHLRSMLRFGGMLTISGVMNPILVNIEKIMLAGIVGTTALTFYMVPYRAVEKVTMFPGALSRALFPVLSRFDGGGDRLGAFRTASRATLVLGWVLLPLFSVLWIAGDPLLSIWMGRDFASQAIVVLLIVGAGFFVNMLAWNAVALLQAYGRPGLQTVLMLCETLVYVPVAYVFMAQWGVAGAAGAWCLRVVVDALVLWWLGWRSAREVGGHVVLPELNYFLATLGAVAAVTLLSQALNNAVFAVTMAIAVALATAAMGYKLGLTTRERAIIRSVGADIWAATKAALCRQRSAREKP